MMEKMSSWTQTRGVVTKALINGTKMILDFLKGYIVNIDKTYNDMRIKTEKMFDKLMEVHQEVNNDPILLKTLDWANVDDEQFYEQNYLVLHIYFDSLTTTHVKQFLTDSMTSLICDLGGNIGLWLGGSLLSIVELLDLLGLLFYHIGMKRDKKMEK